MRERQRPRVQHLPRRGDVPGAPPAGGSAAVSGLSINPFADNGVTEVFEMGANLVLASGFELQFDQRRATERFEHAVMGDRVARLVTRPRDAAPPAEITARDRRPYCSFAWFRHAVHDRKIVAIELVRCEQVTTGRMCIPGECDCQRARRVAIEAMEDADIRPRSAWSRDILADAAQNR